MQVQTCHHAACTNAQCVSFICRFEDYIGQLEAATAIAGLAASEGKAPSIKDRKEIAAIQEVHE